MNNLPHPKKTLVTLAEARAWSPFEYLVQRKFDGELATRTVGNAVLLGELVTNRSGAFLTASDRAMLFDHGSFFAAFTVAEIDGQNMLEFSTVHRWRALLELVPQFPADVVLAHQTNAPSSLTTEEGYCAHAWNAPFGEMLCHKVLSQWICRVSETGKTQSVSICDATTGQARGKVKMSGGRCDRLRVGSLVKIEGLGLTDGGLIREPRPCMDTQDSWLVKF